MEYLAISWEIMLQNFRIQTPDANSIIPSVIMPPLLWNVREGRKTCLHNKLRDFCGAARNSRNLFQ